MRYISTRGKESGLTFEKVLFSGYAQDGGLYFPESIPKLDKIEIENMANLTYPELVKRIMPLFIDESEIPLKDLHLLIERAFKKFSIPEVIAIQRLKDGLNVAELFHGPTLAFKDLALTFVGELYNYFLEKSKKNCIIVVGTSGDTGSAAISAVRGLSMIDIIVLLPKDRCTKIQQLQMTTVKDSNIHNFVVEGTSDDLDVPIKKVFSDTDFIKKFNVCSINSINWARICVQIIHYIYCYFQCRQSPDEKVKIIIPTGACGNVSAGFVARQMGFPVELITVTNPNDIVSRTFKSGDWRMNKDVKATWASAMDIQMPYNVERILLMASNMDTKRVQNIMTEFENSQENGTKIPADILSAIQSVVVDTMSVGDTDIESTILKCSQENNGYLVCPHTATAVKYFYEMECKDDVKSICIATASPAKFPEAIEKSGLKLEMTPEIQKLFEEEEKYEEMKLGQNWENMLRKKIELVSKL